MYNRHTTTKQSVETAEASQDVEQGDTQTPSSMNAPTPPVGKGTKNLQFIPQKLKKMIKTDEVLKEDEPNSDINNPSKTIMQLAKIYSEDDTINYKNERFDIMKGIAHNN